MEGMFGTVCATFYRMAIIHHVPYRVVLQFRRYEIMNFPATSMYCTQQENQISHFNLARTALTNFS